MSPGSIVQSSFATQYLHEPGPLIGRETEISEIKDLLAISTCRLLTLTGPGGIGKTRLSLAVADDVKGEFKDGIYFVSLQSVNSAEFVISAIIDCIGVALHGNDLQTQLYAFLRERQLLLILDNFEQLLPVPGVPLLTELHQAAPEVKILVTSREALKMKEEWLFPLRGLALPAEGEKEIEGYGAVRLFTECARRSQHEFSLREQQTEVIHICRLVEGLPLAIELAASWLSTLSCAEISAEIEANLGFLESRLRNIPDRHRNLRAVFERSWQMLSEQERQVFRKLTVLQGGWDREAAEQVAGASLMELSGLMDKSLVQRVGHRRYAIHTLLRQFGTEKLNQFPLEKENTLQRLCTFYISLMHSLQLDINGFRQRIAVEKIMENIENMRAAWRWAVQSQKIKEIQQAAGTYFYYCQLRSRYQEGVEAFQAAVNCLEKLEPSKKRDLALAQLYNHLGWMYIRTGKFDQAVEVLEPSRKYYREAGGPPAYMGMDSSVPLGIVALLHGEYNRALELGEEARQAGESHHDNYNLSFAHYLLTSAEAAQGHYPEAYQHGQRACALAQVEGNRWFLAYALNEWGNVARAMGRLDEAKQHFQASYAIRSEYNDPEGMAVALNHLGEIAIRQKEFAEAWQLFQHSLSIYEELGDLGGLATTYKGLGQAACGLGPEQQAEKWFQQALRIAAEIRFLPLLLSIFTNVENLLRLRALRPGCVELLKLVLRHPASDQETKNLAREQLAECRQHMPAEQFARNERESESWDLDKAIEFLSAELAYPVDYKVDLGEIEQPLIEPLTGRELEVLRLITIGKTNRQIAEQLVLSVGTVKWYASQIFGKLEVTNRTEAARRAGELNLFR